MLIVLKLLLVWMSKTWVSWLLMYMNQKETFMSLIS